MERKGDGVGERLMKLLFLGGVVTFALVAAGVVKLPKEQKRKVKARRRPMKG